MASVITQFGESAEMYLKTIAELTMSDDVTPISTVADRMDVSPVSATEMVHRLQDRSLVEHLPYKGVRLTDVGRKKATAVIRRHRLWEVFLVEKLGYSWSRAHGLACRLEHSSDSELAERLADLLGNPRVCPHGNPIPGCDSAGTQPEIQAVLPRMSEMSSGEVGVIVSIHPESDSLLEYLERRRLIPGARVRIEELAILDGPISVDVDGSLEIIGRAVASHVYVESTA